MKDKENKSIGAAIAEDVRNICYTMTMIFCALRACDVVDWKWYQVMFPLIFSWALGVAALLFLGVVAVCAVKSKE